MSTNPLYSILYNLDIERAVLSAVIFEPTILIEVSAQIKMESFYLPFHRNLFFTMCELEKENKPLDEIFIKNKMISNDMHSEHEMLDVLIATPIPNVSDYLKQIMVMGQLRELNMLSINMRKSVGEGKSSEEVIFESIDRLEKIGNGGVSNLSSKFIEDTSAQKPEFMCQSWMPIPKNTITFFNAPGGTGKTWLALQLSLRLAKEDENRKIYLWLSEDPEGIVKDRFDAIKEKILFGNYDCLNQIAVTSDFPEHMIEVNGYTAKVSHNFYKMKRELRDYDVIILDPLLAFYGGDENNNSQARVFMQPFLNWCKEESKTLIFLHHSKKDDGSGNGRSRGASALVDACRCVYDMDKYTTMIDGKKVQDPNKKGQVQFSLTKDNYGAGQFLDSYVFSRQLTPADTVVEIVYEMEESDEVYLHDETKTVELPIV